MTAILATDIGGKTFIYMTDSVEHIERKEGIWNWKSGIRGHCADINEKWQMHNLFGIFHEYISEQLESVPIPTKDDDPLEIEINFKTSINWY